MAARHEPEESLAALRSMLYAEWSSYSGVLDFEVLSDRMARRILANGYMSRAQFEQRMADEAMARDMEANGFVEAAARLREALSA